MNSMQLWAPEGVGEVRPADDLAELLLNALEASGRAEWALLDGDIVCITSKVVSKAEGRVVAGEREEAIAAELTDGTRLVAQRGPTRIVRTKHGLTMAAAGIDASNVTPGRVVLLPVDPDASARAVRARLAESSQRHRGVNVGVIVTDTAGRAWREGQTDLAIGAAGVQTLDSHAGREDSYGNPLAVTAPAVADEIAGAAQLVQTKVAGRPFAVIRGLPDLVLAPGEHGPGAQSLVRAEGGDLFGYGSRQAVIEALAANPKAQSPFGAPANSDDIRDAIAHIWPAAQVSGENPLLIAGAPTEGLEVLAFAHGWKVLAAATPGAGEAHRIGMCPAST